HFLAIPAFVELYLLVTLGLRAYLRNPVPWIMIALWAIYAVSVPLFFPDYLTVVLPLAAGNYITLTHTSLWRTAASLLAFPLVWIAVRDLDAKAKVLGIAALGGLAAAVAQHKGLSYHMLPTELFGYTLIGLLAARWLDTRNFGWVANRPLIAGALAT